MKELKELLIPEWAGLLIKTSVSNHSAVTRGYRIQIKRKTTDFQDGYLSKNIKGIQR